jgi:hypothetical protein
VCDLLALPNVDEMWFGSSVRESPPPKNARLRRKTKTSEDRAAEPDDLRPEYQFDYQNARPNRFAGRIDQKCLVVTLDSDVSQVFTTSESVNTVLRALIAVLPTTQRPRVRGS